MTQNRTSAMFVSGETVPNWLRPHWEQSDLLPLMRTFVTSLTAHLKQFETLGL